jgi:hypothetical protein
MHLSQTLTLWQLRNKIYRYLFTRQDKDQELSIPVEKSKDRTLAKSAQFLRTCRMVHNEGCSILYGENTFTFNRHHNTRGTFWESVPKEIGYQDVLHFLKMIGPENLQYLRDIKFVFDDALPQYTPYVDSNEERRYLNDDYLIHCLRILRDAKLRKINMKFYGRRLLVKSDVKFLGYLEQIKADEVISSTHRDQYRYYRTEKKITEQVWSNLKEVMIRKKKLFEKE